MLQAKRDVYAAMRTDGFAADVACEEARLAAAGIERSELWSMHAGMYHTSFRVRAETHRLPGIGDLDMPVLYHSEPWLKFGVRRKMIAHCMPLPPQREGQSHADWYKQIVFVWYWVAIAKDGTLRLTRTGKPVHYDITKKRGKPGWRTEIES